MGYTENAASVAPATTSRGRDVHPHPWVMLPSTDAALGVLAGFDTLEQATAVVAGLNRLEMARAV